MTDIESLIDKVRDRLAKEQMREALRCYHAGAFRSAINATWVSVVFDFIGKIRELDMMGNGAARVKLEALDSMRRNHDLTALLIFEKTLVEEAINPFELISPVEAVDLRRLFEDRNRCSHPSLTTSDEVFQPSAELARAHMIAALSNVLVQSPVQGTAAKTRIFEDVGSDSFPPNADEATEFLRHGALGRAKDTLIRGVIVGITKDLLSETRDLLARRRQFAALEAVRRLHGDQFSRVLTDELPRICANVPESKTPKLIFYAANVHNSWAKLGMATQLQCKNYVVNTSIESVTPSFVWALEVPELRKSGLARIDEIERDSLAKMLRVKADLALKDRALTIFGASGTFKDAALNASQLLLPFARTLSTADLTRIATAFRDNVQIRNSFDIPEAFESIIAVQSDHSLFRDGWRMIYDSTSLTKLRATIDFYYSFLLEEVEESSSVIEDYDDIPF